MSFRELLISDAAIGILLLTVVLILAQVNRSFLRDVFHDPQPSWRVLSRFAAALVMITIWWITLFDRWRQLVDEPARQTKQFPSERIVLDPTPQAIRTTTLILIGLTALAIAPLIARHIGGYFIQFVSLIGVCALWVPIYAVRQRFDAGLALADVGRGLSDYLGLIGYVFLTGSLNVVVILLMSILIAVLVALPVTLLLDLTRQRQPPTTTEAQDFYRAIRSRGVPH